MLRRLIMSLVAVMLTTGMARGKDEVNYYDLLSTDRIGASKFIKDHPTWDGRGVVVAILDTGVDMTVPGLQKTSTGEVKVIDARDFTGQGVVHVKEVEESMEGSEPILSGSGGVVRGHLKLSPAPQLESLRLGFIDERRFQNSQVPDINDNGNSRDRFAVLLGKVLIEDKEVWKVWVDTDGDGHVDDEEAMGEYAENLKPLVFRRQGTEAGTPTMGVAIHLDPKRNEVVFHYPDGSHGSHCAGIASGFEIQGRKGYNGIAPGARVLSLKIGDNTLAGGATVTESMKRAIEFAGNYSKEHNVPVVMNISYGIGTEREGDSDIDQIADRLLQRFPLLAMATSAGNSGPGLSTVGTPAGADLAFSAGALLTQDNAQGLYGARIARDVIFYFSSRGGELGKPNGLAPGVAASTVPNWETWPTMRGTSMASPQCAGAMALLASASLQDDGLRKFNGGILARALANSGKPLEKYTLLDQGRGVVHLPTAWDSLKTLTRRKNADYLAGFQIRGDVPTAPGGKGPAAFFRAGTYIPKSPDAVHFNIEPLFMEHVDAKERESYFETYDLVVDGGDWLAPTSDSVFINKGNSVSVDVLYDAAKLKTPGVHSAVIYGVPRGVDKKKENAVFELWNTVVVPDLFDLTKGFSKEFKNKSIKPGEIERYFFRVPEGAASMRLVMRPLNGKFGVARLAVFDPEGLEYSVPNPYINSEKGTAARVLIDKAQLIPGVWEVVVVSHYVTRKESFYDLDVEFSGFHYQAPKTFGYEMGSPPRGQFEVTTVFDQVFEGKASGAINGFYKRSRFETSSDKISVPFTMEKNTALVRFRLEMNKDTYVRLTDCAVNILSMRNEAAAKGGFSRRIMEIEVANPNAGKGEAHFTLQIVAGFAEDTGKKWGVSVSQYHEQRLQVPAKVWCDGYGYFVLYPNQDQTCEFELSAKPPILPKGYLYYGEIRFTDGRSGATRLVIPMKLKLNSGK